MFTIGMIISWSGNNCFNCEDRTFLRDKNNYLLKDGYSEKAKHHLLKLHLHCENQKISS